ncbi:site-specific integrase [Vibrio cholerae]
MYKVEKCGDDFWCILDVQTTMPPLLSFRWLESQLKENALGTQKSYMDSLKLFYDFWLQKHGVSLDYSFYRTDYQDVEAMIVELDAFWDFLMAGKQITNITALPSFTNATKETNRKKRTAAKHCGVVCNFIKFLNSTYIWELIKKNPLNPIVTYEVQMRNYLLTNLLVKYGLRIGESLLLRKNSFKKSRTVENSWIMSVRNLSDDALDDSAIEDERNNKPQIKTKFSNRHIHITADDYKNLMTYYRFIRSPEAKHDFIFSASSSPFKPSSYSTVMTQFKVVTESFKKHFPEHFDPKYAESITKSISPHWLRHTWAFGTMEHLYEKLKQEFIEAGSINIKGIMAEVRDKLRTLGGWSLKSTMPSKYAKRFEMRKANETLMRVYNSPKSDFALHSFDEELPW